MKCKAKRIGLAGVHMWRVWCPHHEMYIFPVYGDESAKLPHDVALSHIKRYHT